MSEPQGIVRAYRESHHRIAEMVAMGCTPRMISQTLGVGQRRLSLLMQDPTFRELIASKTENQAEKNRETIDIISDTMRKVAQLGAQDMLDTMEAHVDADEDSRLKPMQVLKITTEALDRFGYGKNSTIKVEHDLGNALDRAIKRSGLGPKQIEGEVLRSLPPMSSIPEALTPQVEPPEMKRAPAPPARSPKAIEPGRVSLSEALRRRRVA